MADLGSSTENSPFATNNHYQAFPEAAMKKMQQKIRRVTKNNSSQVGLMNREELVFFL